MLNITFICIKHLICIVISLQVSLITRGHDRFPRLLFTISLTACVIAVPLYLNVYCVEQTERNSFVACFPPCLLIATLQCGILFIHSYAETSSWFLPLSTNILFWGPQIVRASEPICKSKQIHSFKHPLGCQTNCVGSSLFPTFDRGTT